jgi:hypothetical protein
LCNHGDLCSQASIWLDSDGGQHYIGPIQDVAASPKASPAAAPQDRGLGHLHLILEATDRAALLGGLRGLAIRAARAINRAAGRRGRVWAGRFHVRDLRTPREVRNALEYVLHNLKKSVRGVESLDGCATGYWFDGWREPRPRWARPPAGVPVPVRAARTWLVTTGWRRLGLIGFDERPRPPAPRRPGAARTGGVPS